MDSERYELILNLTTDGCWDWDLKTDRAYLSPQYCELVGYSPEDTVFDGDFLKSTIHPDDQKQVFRVFEAGLQGKLAVPVVEYRMISKAGTLRWVEGRASTVEHDEQGMPSRMVGTVVDITDRKRAEEESKLISFTIDNIAEATIWTKPDGGIWNANDVACKRLGYTREELLSLKLSDIDPLFTKEVLQPHWEKVKAAGSLQFESLHKTKDGLVYPVEIIVNRVLHNGIEYHCSIVRDISEHKKLQKALRDSEEQFRTLCNFAPIGIFRSDSEGSNTYSNSRWQEITGLSAAEGAGDGWLRGIHPDDREQHSEVWLEARANGRIFSLEHRQLTPQGKTLWVRALASPIKGTDGKIAGYVGTLEDITELQQARQDMLKGQKLESLGLLAGGIAHDFNNILTGILGNISLARFQLQDLEKVAQRLEDAEKAAVRAKDLTQQLLTFARGGEPIKKIVELGDLLKEASGFALHGANVRCEFVLADDLWQVEADEGQLVRVAHNLILNAVQAMPEGGTVTIVASNVTSLKGKRFVTISVADTGVGIPEHYLQKIFDPYFTTKQQGSGLGLATCYSIIKKHGGKIRATSTLGKGSSFNISLPASSRQCEARPSSQPVVSRGSGRVLVMDDEQVVREITRTVLEEFGYTVECAENGAEAVELYRQRKEQGRSFSAVILDLTIPGGVGGKDTIKKLLQIDPDVKAIVSSGYSNDPIMANYREYGFCAVLTKPYRPLEMNELLHGLDQGLLHKNAETPDSAVHPSGCSVPP